MWGNTRLSRYLQWFRNTRCFSNGRVYSANNGNIYLMGAPGAGKTTVGRMLSQRLNMAVLDIDDDHLEPFWGMTVADKLKEVGPDNFIEAEGEALLNFNASNCIVSLSGSNPMHQQAMEHIRRDGTVVFMDVNNMDILERLERMKVNRIVGQTTGIPMSEILEYRRQFYVKNYDLRVICERDESAESISEKILKELQDAPSRSQFSSTRKATGQLSDDNFCDVTTKGLACDGGLFVPQCTISQFTKEQWETMLTCSYSERAISILEKWVSHKDVPARTLRTFVESAYSSTNFGHPNICPVTHLEDNIYLSELFHGPSASFKDMALQLLPNLFQHAVCVRDPNHRYLILVATSGDTGGAVLDGFSRHSKDVSVVVLYPENGVSSLQKAQMTSVGGSNISVVGVDGDFDFCQTAIKNIFTDDEFASKLSEKYGFKLSAANSINWARLLPQVVYHASSYLDLVKSGVISMGEEVDLCIPTGNFGNILGAYYAKCMGIPVRRLICASNTNNILTELFKTGVYRMNTRKLLQTMSPAIDILKSSNLERYLYHKSGRDHSLISTLYASLDQRGYFEVQSELLLSMKDEIVADWCSESDTMETIKDTFERTGILLDPHTAVARTVADRFNDGKRPMMISSTAHYSKFPEEVLSAIGQDVSHLDNNPAKLLSKLETMNLRPAMHDGMSELKSRERIHRNLCPADTGAVKDYVENFISSS